MTAAIYRRINGDFGASCDRIQDTGHFITQDDDGLYTVHSVEDEERVIATRATKRAAELAIEKDWREASRKG